MVTRTATPADASEDEKFQGMLVQHLGPLFSVIPEEIVIKILLRLSVKRIFVCKCVCKTWHKIISEPEFAKRHLKQAEVYPLIRTHSISTSLSRSLYLVQSDCSDRLVNYKLNTQYKLPLRNIENDHMVNSDGGAERNDSVKLNAYDHGCNIVNSCNGLLCLSGASENDPAVICNPATGEFINLPESKPWVKNPTPHKLVVSGFGFSSASNQYKVIKMFMSKERDSVTGEYAIVRAAEVHTLGSESWRKACLNPKIFTSPYSSRLIKYPTNLNGCVYWYCPVKPRCIIACDIENEQFNPISIPTLEEFDLYENTRMGVLGGELCISGTHLQSAGFWVMKDDSGKAWSKVFSVVLPFDDGLSYGLYLPIKYLNDGSLLMFDSKLCALMYKDPKNGRIKYLKVEGAEQIMEVIAHIPSFVSLQDALSGFNVKVLNVKSSCADLKLHDDAKCLSLVEWDFGCWYAALKANAGLSIL